MIGLTFNVTIPEKPCGINQCQMTSLILSEVASLKIACISSRLMSSVLNCSENLKLLGKSNEIKLGENTNLKITSISSINTSNSLTFILSKHQN